MGRLGKEAVVPEAHTDVPGGDAALLLDYYSVEEPLAPHNRDPVRFDAAHFAAEDFAENRRVVGKALLDQHLRGRTRTRGMGSARENKRVEVAHHPGIAIRKFIMTPLLLLKIVRQASRAKATTKISKKIAIEVEDTKTTPVKRR